MKIEVDKLDSESFTKLQAYLDGESNRYTGEDDRLGKVYVSRIDREPAGESAMYEGVQLDIADGELTREKLYELMDIVYHRKPDPLLDRSIYDLGLPTRTRQLDWRHGIKTVGELIRLTEDDLLEMRNVGRVTVTGIKTQLAKYGLKLMGDGDRVKQYRDD